MVSRLDRLFILLDTGSNESVRLAAAKQLGEVQRVQPDDLEYLLQRIKEYSCKSVWETRVAAGHATRSVLEHVGPWPNYSLEEQSEDDKNRCRQEIALKIIEQNVDFESIFQQFDIEKISQNCPKLLSLDVDEADELETVSTSTTKSTVKGRSRGRKEPTAKGSRANDKEQLMRQRKLINKELGISMVDSLNLGVKSTDIVSNDDLQTSYDSSDKLESATPVTTTSESSLSSHSDTRSIIKPHVSNYDKILNILYQEKCILENKIASKESAKECHDTCSSNIKTTWPLQEIAEIYTDEFFNSSWEVRHGAAIALREIVKMHGKYAGKRSDLPVAANDVLNQVWLVDVALKALCVLALDRFGDFLFDQVVAPVRENAAQLLGCCVASMSETNANFVVKIMLKMLQNKNWETRHGGILGLKYSLNIVEPKLTKRLLQDCFDPIYSCLGDLVDDVSAEAAAALVPVKDLMMEVIPEKAPKLIKFLWEHLADLDELTTSTSNIVLLLASLITSSSAQLEPNELTKSIPRLWSLLGHSSTAVRISVLKALLTLMKPQKSTCLSWMPEQLLNTALRLVFQRSVLENMDEVRPHLEEVWAQLIKVDETGANSSSERFNLLKSTSQFLNYWLCLILQPSNAPIDRGSNMWLNIRSDGSRSDIKPDGEVYIGSVTFNAETSSQQKQQVTKCRLLSTKLLGALYARLINDFEKSDSQHSREALGYLADMFIHYIKTRSANQRMVSGWAIESWAYHQSFLLTGSDPSQLKSILPQSLIDQLKIAIQEITLCYDELASTFTRLQQETRDFVSTLRTNEIIIDFQSISEKKAIYKLDQIQSLCDMNIDIELIKLTSKRPKSSSTKAQADYDIKKSEAYNILSAKKANLTKSLKSTNAVQKNLSTSVLSSLACAHISWRVFPDKIHLLINPLMDSIELEEEEALQNKSIDYLVVLLNVLCRDPKESNNEYVDNIFKRLTDVLSSGALSMIFDSGDNIPTEVPSSASFIDSGAPRNGIDSHKIILLDNLQRKAELNRATSRRQSSISTSSSLKRSQSITNSSDLENESTNVQDELSTIQHLDAELNSVKLRGAKIALNQIVNHFGEDLPLKLPQFWKFITDDMKIQANAHRKFNTGFDQSANDIKLIKSLRLLEVVGGSLHVNLRKYILELFSFLILLLDSSNPIIRHHSAQCIGVVSKMMFNDTIELINSRIISMLNESDNTLARCGAIESIALIIEHLQLELVPRINIFIIHVLRRMSDQNDQVRLMATHCFGKLLSLMPLNLERSKTSQTNSGNSIEIKQVENEDQRFIEQLLDPSKLDSFVIPFEMKAELRSYQQDGLNWLAFLNRFNLHGILCDEMGLGKTFMTICMVAADHFNETAKEKERKCPPSLIVCPSTLTEHWLYEIEKFLPDNVMKALRPVAYAGNSAERTALRKRILSVSNDIKEQQEEDKSTTITTGQKKNQKEEQAGINLVVASYDVVRNDIEYFKYMNWNYYVLDEGHIIKNGKTKLSRAIRLIVARHKLILSGTPIQNNVTELWSLFDFLMPGFLGSERQFSCRYAKPILQSRELKCSSRELEAGALAMESLHRQVLPFILRRLKEEVLDDLPPKIIQDYYCELSPLQHKLYEDFTRSKLCNDVTKKSLANLNDENESDTASATYDIKSNSKSHIFQALQYLKNVCNHPKLVLSAKHSQYIEIKKSLDNEKSSLDDISHSSKLKALKQLLIDCGIGVASSTQSTDDQAQQQALTTIQSVVNQHRALIFCQIRSMVDIIENDLLKKHLPSITFLKLDGSVPSNQRHSIVSRFNSDPSIDILLLTTQIGGLGLNLTGADTVIFVEHDWNPTKDLQAMDRAHRIGQKKVVNVYRLITKGTLEEKIMGLQKFKTMVSNTVINQDNAGLGTMNIDQLFDLFEDTAATSSDNSKGNNNKRLSDRGNSKSFMELLPELWDQQQYETEYDLSNFVASLKN